MKTTISCLVLALLLSAVVALAQPQQSANFRITKSVLDAGGAPGTSTNFRLVSAFGQPTPIGVASSANFSLSAGFLSPVFSVSPLSPIQQLVIQVLTPDARLSWPHVTGAAQYKVYRSSDPLFTPAPSNLLGTASDTSFTDVNVAGLPATRNYYIITATNGSGVLLTMPNLIPNPLKSSAGTSTNVEPKSTPSATRMSKK